MCLDGSFCNIQILRNFVVIASLKQKIDDLLLPLPHSAGLFLHGLHLASVAKVTAPCAGQ